MMESTLDESVAWYMMYILNRTFGLSAPAVTPEAGALRTPPAGSTLASEPMTTGGKEGKEGRRGTAPPELIFEREIRESLELDSLRAFQYTIRLIGGMVSGHTMVVALVAGWCAAQALTQITRAAEQ